MSDRLAAVPSYLLDSTVLIDYLRGNTEVRERLRTLTEDGHQLCICAINVAEIVAGLREEERAATERFLSALSYIDLTFDIAKTSGVYQHAFARRGEAYKITDLLIGAAALAHDAVLLTDNVKDFQIPGLQVERLPSGR